MAIKKFRIVYVICIIFLLDSVDLSVFLEIKYHACQWKES